MHDIKLIICIVLMTVCLTLAIISSDAINRDVYASISIVTGAIVFKELPQNSQTEKNK